MLIMNPEQIQLTFAIIKPHIVKNPLALKHIRYIIEQNQLKIIQCKQIQLKNDLAEQFYGEHKRKFFYNRLITFMASGPSEALILHGDNAIERWRTLMGPTKVFKAMFSHPDSIRGIFGLSDTRNACHGSDSPESVQREIRIIFPQFKFNKYYDQKKK